MAASGGGAQLTKWTEPLQAAKFLEKRENRKTIRKEAHTSRRALQQKREISQAKTNRINGLIKQVLIMAETPPDVSKLDEEAGRTKILDHTRRMGELVNMANVIGVSGYNESMGIIFDALTEQEPCDVIATDEKGEEILEEGGKPKIVRGHRRRSANEALWEINEGIGELLDLVVSQTLMMNDYLMSLQIKRWHDENGVLSNPYIDEIDRIARAVRGIPDPEDTEKLPAMTKAEAAAEGVVTDQPLEEVEIDLEKVKAFQERQSAEASG